MACNCPTLAQVEAGAAYLRCVRGMLAGVQPAAKWDEAAHAGLYRYVATQATIRSERGQTAEQIRAVPYGSEPARTAEYVMRFGDWEGAGSQFWACLGLSKADADAQRSAGSGPHWGALSAAGSAVRGSEGGSGFKEGMPWWGWVLVALGVVAAGYAITRD